MYIQIPSKWIVIAEIHLVSLKPAAIKCGEKHIRLLSKELNSLRLFI